LIKYTSPLEFYLYISTPPAFIPPPLTVLFTLLVTVCCGSRNSWLVLKRIQYTTALRQFSTQSWILSFDSGHPTSSREWSTPQIADHRWGYKVWRRPLCNSPLPVVLRSVVMGSKRPFPYPHGTSGNEKILLSCGDEIVHDLWVERELRIAAAEPTSLLIAWALVPAWSLWEAFGAEKARDTEEGFVFPPLATVASPVLLFSLLAALVASAMSLLSQIFLPATIRNTPPDEGAVRKVQQTSRTKIRVVYLLQMTSCVLYQAVIACTWVLGHSFSTLDLAPLVYMFAVTGIIWPTLAWTPYRNSRTSV